VSERADVLIIGAGASGGVAAAHLARAGMAVTCLEQGGWMNPSDFPADRRDLELLGTSRWHINANVRGQPEDYPCEVSEADIHPLMVGAVGGSTIHYTAIWTRLRPSDFRVRTVDGVGDDWPISYAELQPHFEAIDVEIGASGMAGDPAYPPGAELPLPAFPLGPAGEAMALGMNRLGWHWWPAVNGMPSEPFGDRPACQRRGTCLWGCPEGAKASMDVTHWPVALRHGARLVTGARVREITVDERGRASGATYLDRDGAEHHVPASLVILAANGVGTARLLLLSRSARFPDGLANSSGLVGKRLMMHPAQMVTGVYEQELQSWRGPFGASIVTSEFGESEPSRGFVRGAHWELVPGGPPRFSMVQTGHEHLTLDQGWGANFHRIAREVVGRTATWSMAVEDLPDERNDVTLDADLTDSSGIPAPRIRYAISDMSRASLAWNGARATEAHEAAGATRVQIEAAEPHSGWHLLGTAKMGTDPATSVVDRDCRTHDVPNLYVIDGSVFVTSSAVNPTATICAIAHRAAQHIVRTAAQHSVPA
jgi:choline dehydrogenase-like flavoprotein